MNREEILAKLGDIFEDVLEYEASQITPQCSPDNIEKWDSLNHVHLISAIKENFNFVLTPEEQAEMLNVDLILDIIETRTTRAAQS